MKRRIVTGILAVIVLIVAAALVVPYFVGRTAETSFKARVAEYDAHHPDVLLHVDSYHRGFYSSEATVSLQPQASMNQRQVRIWSIMLGSQGTPEIKLKINHGPIALAAFGSGHVSFMPVLYTVEFQGENLPPMSVLGIFKPEVYSVRYLNGSSATSMTVAPGRYSMGVFGLHWQGMHAELHANADNSAVAYHAVIEPVNYQARGLKNGETYSGKLDGFVFSGDRHRGAHDFWTGKGRTTFRGAEFEVDGQQVGMLKSGVEHSSVDLSNDGQWVGDSAELDQKGGTVKGWPLSSLTFRESVTKVDAAAMRRMLDRLDEIDQAGETGLDRFDSLLPLVVQTFDKTRANADLAVKAPDGRFHVNLDASLDAQVPSAASGADPTETFVDRLNVEAKVDFDRKMLEDLGGKVASGNGGAQVVGQVLDSWSQEGLINKGTDGREHSDIVFRNGQLTINGHVLDGNVVSKAPESN